MRASYDSGRQRIIQGALDIAADEVATHGWHGLQVQTVAIRLGVSRQTIYNTFTNRRGLAQALVLQLTDHFLNGVDQALAGSDDVFEQWRAAVLYTLDTAATNPLLKSILTADGRDELLPLLTTDAEPVISAARGKLADAVITVRPDVSPEDARDAAETATRLAISHVVLPLHPSAHVANHIAMLVTRFLGDKASSWHVS
ncbi:transcriptional regulator, TetR family [Pseudonocardia ammonioxydans]|uniref:Transcriptional regulator, TetR family n=1 Tax=Pseudonocardia ammonioxydans TaxID=260086 RepID=A0A1I5H8Z7_PSUAM|nr:TetR/AcrR family transcriptional regulator [Pseudonocardia ammonioxydans]SFO44798.1 transcriptional regulator, TetR family [Pseudonocardia ammonioxydans]